MLFTYVAAHLVNHTLGLVSVAVAERGLKVTLTLWHRVPGTSILYGAAGIHLALAFDAIYSRRTLPGIHQPVPRALVDRAVCGRPNGEGRYS